MTYKIIKESKRTHIKTEIYATDYFNAKKIYEYIQNNINQNNDYFVFMESE